MKQKYLMLRNDKKSELIIREFAESGKKDVYPLRSEERYDGEVIKSTISKGKQALVAMLRTQNMNPPRLYAEEIAESVMNLYSSEANQSIELLFDDKDYFLNIMEP